MTRGRAARGPGNRCVEIGNFDEVVAADLFLGVGIRTVEHLRLAVGDADGGRVGQTASVDSSRGKRRPFAGPRRRPCKRPRLAAAAPASFRPSRTRSREGQEGIASRFSVFVGGHHASPALVTCGQGEIGRGARESRHFGQNAAARRGLRRAFFAHEQISTNHAQFGYSHTHYGY